MGKTRLLALAVCTAAVVGLGAGSAFAGEVKGPPGTPCDRDPATALPDCVANNNFTGAREHSNSICSFNGLNDMNQGPTLEITQTPANQGNPGDAGHGTCAGGTNPHNPPTS